MTWRHLPGSSRLLVHRASGRSATGIRMLSGTSDWRRDVADRFGVAALRVVGASVLAEAPEPTWPAAGIDELDDELRTALPGFRPVGVVLPRQPGRHRLSALGRMTGNLIVVKLGDASDELRREATVLQMLTERPLPGIHTPEPIAFGKIALGDEPVTFLATTGVALRGQRPAIDEPLFHFERNVAERLGDLPDDDGGDGTVPVHGDLTPWNLRRTGRGLALFDWEHAGWGAPGSDIAHYRSTCADVRPPWRRHRSRRRTIGAVS